MDDQRACRLGFAGLLLFEHLASLERPTDARLAFARPVKGDSAQLWVPRLMFAEFAGIAFGPGGGAVRRADQAPSGGRLSCAP
jgi:hypothetical protein